jgi:guanylate kinase
MGRFIILSGPSCVGKGPLHEAFIKFYPELAGKLKKLILYNSRSPRPAEIDGKDYHFRKLEVEQLRGKESFIVLDVRGDLQAIDLEEASKMLNKGDLFYEGNPFVGCKLKDAFESKADIVSIFLAPLARDEILYLRSPDRHVSLADIITDVMRRKLLSLSLERKPCEAVGRSMTLLFANGKEDKLLPRLNRSLARPKYSCVRNAPAERAT